MVLLLFSKQLAQDTKTRVFYKITHNYARALAHERHPGSWTRVLLNFAPSVTSCKYKVVITPTCMLQSSTHHDYIGYTHVTEGTPHVYMMIT